MILGYSSKHFFKIGIATDIFERVGDYIDKGYGCLHLIHLTGDISSVCYLEASLIREFKSYPGIQNVGKGGEHPIWDDTRPPYQLYLANSD